MRHGQRQQRGQRGSSNTSMAIVIAAGATVALLLGISGFLWDYGVAE